MAQSVAGFALLPQTVHVALEAIRSMVVVNPWRAEVAKAQMLVASVMFAEPEGLHQMAQELRSWREDARLLVAP